MAHLHGTNERENQMDRKLPGTLSVMVILGMVLATLGFGENVEIAYQLSYIRRIGSEAVAVLAMPGAVAFGEGSTLVVYDSTGETLLDSIDLPCYISGLGRSGDYIIAAVCNGIFAVDATDKTDLQEYGAGIIDTNVCLIEDESFVMGIAVNDQFATIGLWTSACMFNWTNGATLQDIGFWTTGLQYFSIGPNTYLATLELDSAYDEEVEMHSTFTQSVNVGQVEVQYVANDFAIVAGKLFSTATGPQNEGLCASFIHEPDTQGQMGTKIDCIYEDEVGARKLGASADSERGDNAFTVRQGLLRWVKSPGDGELAEVASSGYLAIPYDIGTAVYGNSLLVYVAGSDGVTIYRAEYVTATSTPTHTPTQTPTVTPTSTPVGSTPVPASTRVYVPIFMDR